MAALSVQDRTRIWRGLMRKWSKEGVTLSFTKYALYDPIANTGAVADVDNWLDARAGLTGDTVGYNGCFAANMRAALNTSQKAFMLCVVAACRVDGATVRKLLEVD